MIEEWTPLYEQVNPSVESLSFNDMVFLDKNPFLSLSTRLPNLKSLVLQDTFKVINNTMTIDMNNTAFDQLKLVETKSAISAFLVSNSVFPPKINLKISMRDMDGTQHHRHMLWYNNILTYKDDQDEITN